MNASVQKGVNAGELQPPNKKNLIKLFAPTDPQEPNIIMIIILYSNII